MKEQKAIIVEVVMPPTHEDHEFHLLGLNMVELAAFFTIISLIVGIAWKFKNWKKGRNPSSKKKK